MNKVKIILVILVLAVLVVAGYFLYPKLKTDKVEASVATVNGVAIAKTEYETQFASAVNTYKTQGVDVENAEILAQIKTQVLDNLINTELVNQAVAEAGIKVNDADVQTQFQSIVDQAGGAEKLKEELTKANLTEAQLKENISKQLAFQVYITANVDMNSVTATDAEISQFYAEYSKAQKDAGVSSVPELKDLSEQIKQQIILNKQQVLVNDFVAALRNKAEVVISI